MTTRSKAPSGDPAALGEQTAAVVWAAAYAAARAKTSIEYAIQEANRAVLIFAGAHENGFTQTD